jgi:hypothetical protein
MDEPCLPRMDDRSSLTEPGPRHLGVVEAKVDGGEQREHGRKREQHNDTRERVAANPTGPLCSRAWRHAI